MKLSVLIPVYNEEETVEEIIDMVKRIHMDKEIIIIDDPELTANCRVLATKILTMPTENCYNLGLKVSTSLTLLLVNLLKYAQRHPKNTSFRRRLEPCPLWRYGSFSAVLSKIGFETIPAKLHSLGKTQQPISPGSIDSDYNLHNGGWNEADLGHQNSALQRILPGTLGVERLPGQFDFERFPEEFDNVGNRRHQATSRFVAQYDSESNRNPQQSYFRFGFDRPAGLRL